MKKTKAAQSASIVLGAVALAFGSTATFAQDYFSQNFIKPYDETFTLNLGGIVNQFDTSLKLNGSGSQGSDVNLENNGLKKNLSSFEGMATWRFAPRHRVDVDYYTVSRSGSHTYSTDINIGGNDYTVGATVGIHNKYDFGSIDYRYSFYQTPDFEVAALVGIYGGKITFDVTATPNPGSGGATYNRSVSTTLPLPMLGIGADWYPSTQTRLGLRGMGMSAKIGDVDGHAYQAAAEGEYMLARNFGIGARWVYTDIKADVDKSDFDGGLKWRANSASLYAKITF
jgi:hypothetical protein